MTWCLGFCLARAAYGSCNRPVNSRSGEVHQGTHVAVRKDRMTKIVAAFVGAIVVAVTFAACRPAEPEYGSAESIMEEVSFLEELKRCLAYLDAEDYSAYEDAECDQALDRSQAQRNSASDTTASPAPTRPAVTAAAFASIREGMTYAEVQRLIGAPGVELSRLSIAGYTTVIYMWSNADGSNMNAVFRNGDLVAKAQFGLR